MLVPSVQINARSSRDDAWKYAFLRKFRCLFEFSPHKRRARGRNGTASTAARRAPLLCSWTDSSPHGAEIWATYEPNPYSTGNLITLLAKKIRTPPVHSAVEMAKRTHGTRRKWTPNGKNGRSTRGSVVPPRRTPKSKADGAESRGRTPMHVSVAETLAAFRSAPFRRNTCPNL